ADTAGLSPQAAACDHKYHCAYECEFLHVSIFPVRCPWSVAAQPITVVFPDVPMGWQIAGVTQRSRGFVMKCRPELRRRSQSCQLAMASRRISSGCRLLGSRSARV